MGKAIKVDEKNYTRLNNYAGILRAKLGKPVSLNEVISLILDEYEKMKKVKKT